MEAEAVLALIGKGISIASSLLTANNIAGAKRALTAVTSIVRPPEGVTQAEGDAVDAELDALLDEFNLPL